VLGVEPLAGRQARPRSHRGSRRPPGRVWIVARVDIDDGLRGDQVKSLVCGIESGLKKESDNVYRADVVPVSTAQAATPT